MAAKALFWFLLTGKILFTLKQATIIVPAYNREVEKSEAAKTKALEASKDNPEALSLIKDINTNPAHGAFKNIGRFLKGLWYFHIKPKPVNLVMTLIMAALLLAFIIYEIILHQALVKALLILTILSIILIAIINNVPYLQSKRMSLTNAISKFGVRIANFVKMTIIEEEGRNPTSNVADSGEANAGKEV